MNAAYYDTTACRRLYREEDWIDWLRGHANGADRLEMERHLSQCVKCREIVAEWKPLLQEKAGLDEAPGEAAMPSRSVYRRLRTHVRARSIVQTIQGRGKRFAAAAAALALLVGVFGLYETTRDRPSDRRSVYVAQYEPKAVSFIHDPSTASYRIHPYNDELGEGYVWFNGSSQEVLVLLEGLLPSENYVLQAWAVDDRGRANLGLLRHVEASREHLYFKGEQLAGANHIVLTVEPLGGSDRPTTPDAFVFELRDR